jgi:hypothetical protein
MAAWRAEPPNQVMKLVGDHWRSGKLGELCMDGLARWTCIYFLSLELEMLCTSIFIPTCDGKASLPQ